MKKKCLFVFDLVEKWLCNAGWKFIGCGVVFYLIEYLKSGCAHRNPGLLCSKELGVQGIPR